MPPSLSGKIARGATWMLLFRLADRGLAFVSTIILARVLTPADFGLVAMAMSVIALVELAGAFSLEVALIQRPNPTRQHYDTTWTLRLAFGAFCALATAALAYPATHFFGDPRIQPIMLALALNWLIGSFENIGVVNFRRELDFRRDFWFLMSKRLAGMPVTIGLAIAFHSYWALIAGTMVGTVAAVLLSFLMHPFRPRFCLSEWRELMSFSVWLFIYNAMSFLQLRLSHFVIGRAQGAGPLGIFTVATDFAALASTEITMPINRAILPGLSRMAEQADGIRRGMLQITAAVMMITLPAAFGLAAIAEPVVMALLGDQWADVVPILQILAFAGALQSVIANNHSAYIAKAKAHISVLISASFVAALAVLLVALQAYGVLGVALAQLSAMAFAVSVSVSLMRRVIGTTAGALASVVWRSLAAAALMGAAVYWLDRNYFGVEDTLAPYARVLVGVAIGVTVYVPALLLLWLLSGRSDGAEAMVIERLRALLRTRS
jgi:PST family polysaccharide transporter